MVDALRRRGCQARGAPAGFAPALLLLGIACSGGSLRPLGNTSDLGGLETVFRVAPAFPIASDFVMVCLEAGSDRFQVADGAFVERGGAAVDLAATVELEGGESVALAGPYGMGGGGDLAYCRSEIGLRGQRVTQVTLRLSRAVPDVRITLRGVSPP